MISLWIAFYIGHQVGMLIGDAQWWWVPFYLTACASIAIECIWIYPALYKKWFKE
jgi:hypothetical protein